MVTDRHYMLMALSLAEKGLGTTSPNPAVGAVVVRDGRVVGKGWHQKAGGPHAEVVAIDDAGPEAEGATLYVTLEPCNHTGRTPPCTQKILSAGIRRVVMAVADPNPRVTGGGAAALSAQGVEVTTGICEEAGRRLLAPFAKYILTGRPLVTLKCAATLDGRIATRTGHSQWITGPEARGHVHRLRHRSDAILVGIGTVEADDPQLTTRLTDMEGRDPVRVILDSRLSIDEQARVLDPGSTAPTIVACAGTPDAEKAARLEARGVRVLSVRESDNGQVDWVDLLDRLGEMQMTSLFIEGGSRVIASALAADIVDSVVFFYGPKLLGGDDGIPVSRGVGPERMDQAMPVGNIQMRRFGDDIMIEGDIHDVYRHH